MLTRESLADAATAAAGLLADDPPGALAAADAILQLAPRDPRALLIRASALRRLGDFGAAHAVLVPLATSYPKAARTQYELGMVALAMGRPADGVAALRRAVAIDADLGEARRALGDHWFRQGDSISADREFAELERRAIRDPALRPAADALFAGDLARAETLLRMHLDGHADDFEALRLMGEVRSRQCDFAAAEVLFGHCLARDPAHDGVRFSYALALFKQQSGTEALAQLTPLLAKDATNSAYRNLHAATLALLGRHDEALAVYEGLLAEFTRHPDIWLNYGHALRTVLRRDDAVAAYRRAIAIAPQSGEAYWSLANLKTVRFTAADEAQMRRLLAMRLPDDDRMRIAYALGRRLEETGNAEEAFAHYAQGAALARVRFAVTTRDYPAEAALVEQIFTGRFLSERADWGADDADDDAPIFIVGLPRSGSTLVEQILASHPAIEGTMELPYIGAVAAEIARAGGVQALAAASASQLRGWGERYLAQARVHRRLGRRHFIDKMPNNFRHIGLIRLILPRARIIDVRRQPMAAGFSAFKQLFAEGQEFSYDLDDIGRYYRHYLAIVRHFQRVQPGAVYSLRYEDLVEDTESEVRRLLAALDLSFDPACLRFFENDRAVRTVSSEQVRRPIFREGLDQWRHYEPWLGRLKAALGRDLEGWRN